MHDFALKDRLVLEDLAGWIVARRDPRAPTAPLPSAGVDGASSLPQVGGEGIGLPRTWQILRDRILSTAFATDHPGYLAFVGGAPTSAAVIADAALSAASVYGGSELEAGDVVVAERAAARWLCDLVGYPDQAHGVFVSGGSAANLSALVAARRTLPPSRSSADPGVIVAGASSHSSVMTAASIMGCRVVLAGAHDRAMSASDVESALAPLDPDDVIAVVASAGATNTGAVDALDEIADSCAVRGIWFHVDAAYGGAALLAPSLRAQFAGIERADSVTIDPHKWLFTPLDCGAVLYRDPFIARLAHRQMADYLDVVHPSTEAYDNPSDYSVQLSRRARGLPVWASLVANGTDAYVHAVEECVALAEYAARRICEISYLSLASGPLLSVVLFDRLGWGVADYDDWSLKMRSEGTALVTRTRFEGRDVLRLCFVNPLTSTQDIDLVVDSLAAKPCPVVPHPTRVLDDRGHR